MYMTYVTSYDVSIQTHNTPPPPFPHHISVYWNKMYCFMFPSIKIRLAGTIVQYVHVCFYKAQHIIILMFDNTLAFKLGESYILWQSYYPSWNGWVIWNSIDLFILRSHTRAPPTILFLIFFLLDYVWTLDSLNKENFKVWAHQKEILFQP